jgi:hypothetical protein
MANVNNGSAAVVVVDVTTPEKAVAAAQAGVGKLVWRRTHPGGGVLGRCSYGVAGVPGIVVYDVGLFAPATPPAVLYVCTLENGVLVPVQHAMPQPRKVAGVTSAIVAQANTAVAQATNTPIAPPAAVAAAATKATGKAVAAATRSKA